MALEIRQRDAHDLGDLATIANLVRKLDGYGGPNIFSSPDLLDAWVATDGADVCGHVALHRSTAASVMELAAEVTGWPMHRLIVVSRLLVAPTCRRRGVGRLLLAQAVVGAHALDSWPILDVGIQFKPALALYESCGWKSAGRVTFPFRDGATMRQADSVVYIGPKPGDD